MSAHCFIIGVTLNDNPVASHFSALARQLAARGHKVVLITPHRMLELENADGNPAIYTWPSDRPTRFRDAAFLWRLIRLLREAGLARQLSRQARFKAAQFDWSMILPLWERLLNNVACSGNSLRTTPNHRCSSYRSLQ